MDAYLLTFACIFAVNLLPAFGPPTWALLVFFRLQYDLPIVPMVLGAAPPAAALRSPRRSCSSPRGCSIPDLGYGVGGALQIAMLLAIIALLRIDWASRLARH